VWGGGGRWPQATRDAITVSVGGLVVPEQGVLNVLEVGRPDCAVDLVEGAGPVLHHLRRLLVAVCQVPGDNRQCVAPAQEIVDVLIRLFDAPI
jgi:hypothetical protein